MLAIGGVLLLHAALCGPPVSAEHHAVAQRVAAGAPSMGLSRHERRKDWWEQNGADGGGRGGRSPATGLTVSGVDASVPHPLEAALQGARRTVFDATAAGRHQPGDELRVLVEGASPLGLTVATLPDGEPAVVYNDEAGFAPDGVRQSVSPGDVVPAWVLKVRDADGKLDASFRPAGALPKLAGAAGTLLRALFEEREAGGEGVVELGDASSPAAIKLALGLSKSNFKAARGMLLKRGLLSFPLSPTQTRLAPNAAWPEEGVEEGGEGGTRSAPPEHRRTVTPFELVDLPPALYDDLTSGASALIDMLHHYGEVSSIRGLRMRDGEASGRATVRMASEEGARAAVADLSRYDAPPYLLRRRSARTERPADRRRDSDARREDGAGRSTTAVFVGNLGWETCEDDLWDLFLDCGYIEHVELTRTVDGPAHARVTFADAEGAERALQLRGSRVGGLSLRVERAYDEAAPDDRAAGRDRPAVRHRPAGRDRPASRAAHAPAWRGNGRGGGEGGGERVGRRFDERSASGRWGREASRRPAREERPSRPPLDRAWSRREDERHAGRGWQEERGPERGAGQRGRGRGRGRGNPWLGKSRH
jgi:hypothetical protein